MNQTAIQKAEVRLAKAQEAYGRIQSSTTFDEIESAWTDFLIHTHSIHSILEKGARSSPQSRQWYGGKKNERRTDPLLQYLHQARNADEHGIEPITERVKAGMGIGVPGETLYNVATGVDKQGRIWAKTQRDPLTGEYPTIKITHAHARLIPVYDDRSKRWFQPPKEHLGKPVFNATLQGIAAVGLGYHMTLIAEGEKLIK